MLQPRQAHALVKADDGRIYAIGGGRGVSGTGLPSAITGTVEVYDPATNRWTEVAPMSVARWGLSAVTLNGHLFAFGGAPPVAAGGVVALGVTEQYDPAADTWSLGSSLALGRADAAAAVDGEGRAWAFWGWTEWPEKGAELADTIESLAGGQWVTWAGESAPAPRTGARAVSGPNGEIYVLGGVADALLPPPSNWGSDAHRFVPASGSWQALSEMPIATWLGASALGSDGRIYYAGGYGGSEFRAAVYACDPAQDSWTEVASLPVPLWDTAAVTGDDGRIYVVGGSMGDESPTALERMFVYDPVRDEWYQ
jgi:N-acetylneuraminic acid mutarotase